MAKVKQTKTSYFLKKKLRMALIFKHLKTLLWSATLASVIYLLLSILRALLKIFLSQTSLQRVSFKSILYFMYIVL